MTMLDRSKTRREPDSQYARPQRITARISPARRATRPENGAPAVRGTVADRPADRSRAMSPGTAIFLITVGAILMFALTASASPGWIDLHVVGLILMLAGVLGLVLPRLTRPSDGGLRRWVVPMLPPGDELRPGGGQSLIRRPGVDDAHPTLADELLGDEHDPPAGH